MSGNPVWDAVIWLVLGAVAGWAIAKWSRFRAALVFAVLISVIGVFGALALGITQGEAGLGYALAVLFWSVPCSVGLVLGGIVRQVTARNP